MNKAESGPSVYKAGGTSLATSEKILTYVVPQVRRIEPVIVTVSSAGSRYAGDPKLTDLSIICADKKSAGEGFDREFDLINARFREIGNGLGVPGDYVARRMSKFYDGIVKGKTREWIITCGERDMAAIIARHLGFPYIDARRFIRLTENGEVDASTYDLIKNVLGNIKNGVVNGFQGEGSDGKTKAMKRGGTDLTASVIAAGINAIKCINSTDVVGVRATDPRIVDNPAQIPILTYNEMQVLADNGAGVLQDQSIRPLVKANIPLEVVSTFHPDEKGTLVVKKRQIPAGETVIGVTGKEKITAINLKMHKAGDREDLDPTVSTLIDEIGVPYKALHSPGGSQTIVFDQSAVNGHAPTLVERIQQRANPQSIVLREKSGLVSVVGQGIARAHLETRERLTKALNSGGIDMQFIHPDRSGICLAAGVQPEQLNDAIRAAYREFIKK